jgi:hypothetical protein
MFSCPKDKPKDVSKEIDKLFFIDPPSASAHVRIALENLLTYLKVKSDLKKRW